MIKPAGSSTIIKMQTKRIVILGAGGQAREIVWLIRDINQQREEFEVLGYLVPDLSKLSEYDTRDGLLGDESWLDDNRGKVDCLAIGIGDPFRRCAVANKLASLYPELSWPTLIHPTAIYDKDSCQIGPGVLICAGVICTINIEFGPFSLINFGCTIGHDVRVGRGCVVNPGSNVSGGVILEEGVLIGTGAKILQYLQIGSGAIVGAGAVVVEDVAKNCTVVGIPARPMEAH